MLRQICIFIFSLSLGLNSVVAQKAAPPDSAKSFSLKPTALRFGVDLNPWISGISNGDKTLYNVHLRIEANRWGLLLDGNHSETGVQDSTTYAHNGNYLRLGVVYNLLKNDTQGNLFYLGLGYGRSWFSESFSGQVQDPVYGTIEINREANDLRGGWLEAGVGIQARIWKQLFAGYELRLKFASHFTDDNLVQLYQVPGYGRASDKSQVGFSYYLLYRIPLSKQ